MTFPAAEVIYGDSLKKATLSGQSGEGVFRFADDTTMLTVAEDQSEQEMIFTPVKYSCNSKPEKHYDQTGPYGERIWTDDHRVYLVNQ